MEPKFVGFPWYTREDYPRVLEVMADAARLPRTFDAWEAKAQQGVQAELDKGRIPVKAELKADLFVAWCQVRGLNVDSAGRLAWANEVAREHALHGRKGR